MSWTDEQLMAHADGEGSARQRAALDAAMREDAGLKQRWLALVAQRERVAAAFASMLDEPLPDRLLTLLGAPAAVAPAAPPAATATARRSAPPSASMASPLAAAAREVPLGASAPVVDLATARSRRDNRRRVGAMGWMQWGGLAASLGLGLALGLQMAPRNNGLLVEAGGQLVAGARLGQALDAQLAGDAATAAAGGVQVQLSFVDQGGRYCRTFSTDRVAGLACREGSLWAVQATTGTEPAAEGRGMRPAASTLPKAVLDSVDGRISGDTLSATQERAARERGWHR